MAATIHSIFKEYQPLSLISGPRFHSVESHHSFFPLSFSSTSVDMVRSLAEPFLHSLFFSHLFPLLLFPPFFHPFFFSFSNFILPFSPAFLTFFLFPIFSHSFSSFSFLPFLFPFYLSLFFSSLFSSFNSFLSLLPLLVTPHVQRKRDKVIGVGVNIIIYNTLRLWTKKKFNCTSVIDLPFQIFAVSRPIYRLALPLLSPDTLSSLSKLRVFLLMCTLLYLSEG